MFLFFCGYHDSTQVDHQTGGEHERYAGYELRGVEEKAEQAVLRRAYIDGFKASLEGQLNSITVVEKDGSKHKLEKKK